MTKISALSDIGTSVASNDTFVLVDVSDPTTPNKKIQQQNLFLIPDGSAGTPGLRFLSDTNVGLFRPTTDTLAIATGGSERLRIDSSGRLGLGTSSVGTLLHLSQSITNATTITEANSHLQIQSGSGAGTEHRSTIYFNPLNSSGNGSPAAISAIASGNTNSSLAFYTNGSGNYSGTPVERLRIDDQGRVGIGTSPASLLDCVSNSNSSVAARVTNANSGTVALAHFVARNGTNAAEFGIAGTGWTAYGQTRANGAFIYTGSPAGIGLSADNASGIISFGTGNGATERARIDSSGRLLVGTSSARGNFYNDTNSARFQVEGADNDSAAIAVVQNFNGNTLGGQLILAKSNLASVGSNTLVAAGDRCGTISFQGNDGTQFVEAALIRAEVDGTPGADDMPGRLVFSTTADGASSPTERMRISNDGNVNVGGGGITARVAAASTATSTTVFYGYANTASYTSTVIQAQSETSAGTGWNLYLGYASAGNLVYRVYGNGNVQNANNSYAGTSDIKLKENIVDANSQWDDLKALQVRNYNFKEGQTHTQIGLVAQEVELVSPGLVSESPDRDEEGNDLGTVTKSVNYSVLYMKAVKALQEAMERIETLEAKVAALEGV